MPNQVAWLHGSKRSLVVKNFNIFGSLCYGHVPDQRRKKLDDKHEKIIFVRYNSTGSYKLYNPENQQVTFSRDVYFDEACSWEEFQPKAKTSSNIQIGWEDVGSRVEAKHKEEDNEAQRFIGISTRARQVPSRSRDCQIIL